MSVMHLVVSFFASISDCVSSPYRPTVRLDSQNTGRWSQPVQLTSVLYCAADCVSSQQTADDIVS